MKVYEYAIVLQPKYNDDGNKIQEGRLIAIDKVLADSDDQAKIKIHRAIPEAEIENLDRIEVAIRPF